MATPAVLRNLRIKRVALVDAGANFDKKTGDGAHIMLYKAAPSLSSVHVDSTDWESDYEKANLTADQRDKLPDSAFAAVWTDEKGKKHRKLPIHDAGHLAAARGRIDQADIPADVKAAARRKIEAATNKSAQENPHMKKSMIKRLFDAFKEPDAEKQAAAIGEIEKDFPPDSDDKPVHKSGDPMCKCDDCMSKRAPDPAVAKRMDDIEKANKDLAKANEDLQKKLDGEVEKREITEVKDVLKSFKHISVDIEKDAPIYLALKKANSAAYEKAIGSLTAADKQLSESALFKNVGSGRNGGTAGSAWSQIEAKADALVEKSKDLTREQALEKVMLDPANMSLVKSYREQQTVQ